MRKIILAAMLLAFTISAADARRRHHYRLKIYRYAPVMVVAPYAMETRTERPRVEKPAQLVPRDWQLLAPDPNWEGRRYASPERDAWLAFYAVKAANDAQARFETVAFADGEELKYLRGGRDWLTVSGIKGDNIFYRKVTLACGGTSWRHFALEYPAAAKSKFDRLVERLLRDFDQIAEDSCADNLFSPPAPASEQPKPQAKPANGELN